MLDSVLKAQVIGQGKWRQLALLDGSLRNRYGNSDERENLVDDGDTKPKLSLSFARKCLLNALYLQSDPELKHAKYGLETKSSPEEMESSETTASKNSGHKNLNSSDAKSKDIPHLGQGSANGDAREHRGATHANTAAASTMSEYEDICWRESQKIKQAVLTDMALVELELGNPLKALSTALSLLILPECSRIYAFRGHVYAAEALCLLNRPEEAAEHLSTYPSGGINVEFPYSEEDCKQWLAMNTTDPDDSNSGQTAARTTALEEKQDNVFPSPGEARGALYVNLASMYVVQGNLEHAYRYATQALTSAPNSQEAALMLVYLDLKLGKPQEAVPKLKRFSRIRFLPYCSRSQAASRSLWVFIFPPLP